MRPTADIQRGHRGAHAALRSERRRPEETVLYQVVQQAHWGEFCERAEESGGLPAFVTREVDEYLTYGILERGFLRLACLSCGHGRLVGFSCKRRGFCPSCLGRRMTDTATHLAENVFPPQMVRQWVCSLPWKLRSLLGYYKALCAQVLAAFTQEVQRSLRHRAGFSFLGSTCIEHGSRSKSFASVRGCVLRQESGGGFGEDFAEGSSSPPGTRGSVG